MKHIILLNSIAVAGLMLAGCAAQPPAKHQVPSIGAPESRVVELPEPPTSPPDAGHTPEVRVLVDEPALKLVSIVLHRGTALPTHQSPVPVTITAIEGSGTVVAGSERLRLDSKHAVVLAPSVAHAVEPDAGTDLVLLVHHLGRLGEHRR
jgi:quercetin dioxygenase-like cupin family protein